MKERIDAIVNLFLIDTNYSINHNINYIINYTVNYTINYTTNYTGTTDVSPDGAISVVASVEGGLQQKAFMIRFLFPRVKHLIHFPCPSSSFFVTSVNSSVVATVIVSVVAIAVVVETIVVVVETTETLVVRTVDVPFLAGSVPELVTEILVVVVVVPLMENISTSDGFVDSLVTFESFLTCRFDRKLRDGSVESRFKFKMREKKK